MFTAQCIIWINEIQVIKNSNDIVVRLDKRIESAGGHVEC